MNNEPQLDLLPLNEPSHSNPLTLEQAFDSTFHGRFSFVDFCESPIAAEYIEQRFRGRAIYRPSDKLKKFHRLLIKFVFNYCDVNEVVVHSYRRGRNPLTAVEPHRTHQFIFVTDIEKFFDQITIEDVSRVLRERANASPIVDLSDYVDRISQLVTVAGKLPVGFPTSPPITNSHLFEFDNALADFCANTSITYSRYSDDLILSTDERSALNNIADVIQNMLHNCLGMQYNLTAHKTRLLHKGTKINILGLSLLPNDKISVDRKLKLQVESLLHFYINDKEKFDDSLAQNFGGKLGVVKGRLNHIELIDPDYIDKLRKRYGNFVVDYFRNLDTE